MRGDASCGHPGLVRQLQTAAAMVARTQKAGVGLLLDSPPKPCGRTPGGGAVEPYRNRPTTRKTDQTNSLLQPHILRRSRASHIEGKVLLDLRPQQICDTFVNRGIPRRSPPQRVERSPVDDISVAPSRFTCTKCGGNAR